MPRKPGIFGGGKPPHFIREWRKARHLTQEQLIARLIEFGGDTFPTTTASLSRLENYKQPYSQPLLEALADVLSTDAGSLIMRNPLDPAAFWSIWDHASTGERQQITAVAEALTAYKAEPKSNLG
jgi:transcriptional regulator with XRE-family HTH domain